MCGFSARFEKVGVKSIDVQCLIHREHGSAQPVTSTNSSIEVWGNCTKNSVFLYMATLQTFSN